MYRTLTLWVLSLLMISLAQPGWANSDAPCPLTQSHVSQPVDAPHPHTMEKTNPHDAVDSILGIIEDVIPEQHDDAENDKHETKRVLIY